MAAGAGRSGLTRVCSKDQGKGAFQRLGIAVWNGTGSGCASLAASGISHGQRLWPAPGVSQRRAQALHWPLSLREESICVFLMCLESIKSLWRWDGEGSNPSAEVVLLMAFTLWAVPSTARHPLLVS